MEPWRTILLIATIAGFVVTVVGLVAAYMAARREYRNAGARIDKMRELDEEEDRAKDALKEELADDSPDRTARFTAIYEDFTARYAEHDLVRPTYDNLVYLTQYESQRLLGMVMSETRRDFVIAGVGLLVSTIASAGSLYLVGA